MLCATHNSSNQLKHRMKRIQYRLMVLALRAAKTLAIAYARNTGNPPRNILSDAEGDSRYYEVRRPSGERRDCQTVNSGW